MRYLVRNIMILFIAVRLHAEMYPEKFEGDFEEWKNKPFELISHLLPQNPIIIQAGGHHGKETLEMAQCWPKSKIFTFEPNPYAFNVLSSNVANHYNIHAYRLALYYYSGYATFYLCHGTYGKSSEFEHASSLLKPDPSMEIHYQGPIFDVACTTLDHWCLSNRIQKIDLLRLDIQGAELEVLKSSPRLLSTISCIYIHTYFYPFRIGIALYPELRQFLEESGFKLLSLWYREGLEGEAIFIR